MDLSKILERPFHHNTLQAVSPSLYPVLKPRTAVGKEARNSVRFFSRLNVDPIENLRPERELMRCRLSIPTVFTCICAHLKPFPLGKAGVRTQQQRRARGRPLQCVPNKPRCPGALLPLAETASRLRLERARNRTRQHPTRPFLFRLFAIAALLPRAMSDLLDSPKWRSVNSNGYGRERAAPARWGARAAIQETGSLPADLGG